MDDKLIKSLIDHAYEEVLKKFTKKMRTIISASVAKETTEATRARGYSIFYMMVNFGAFTGKTIIDPLRLSLIHI